MSPSSWGLVGVVLVLLAVLVLLRRRRHADLRGRETLKLAIAENQHIPPTLHPVIDPNLCISSFSCVAACPEGDIIQSIDGIATLVEAAHCIGHARCAIDCPVGAIKLVFGTKERGIDLPETDANFESSRAGVYIIGELGGMGLIKNALEQGLQAAEALRRRLGQPASDADQVDAVVIGGGPAGIAAAIGLKKAGLRARVLEQDTLGGTIVHYPRGKVVMMEAVVLPSYGKFGRPVLLKEELLRDLNAVIDKTQVSIEEQQRVVAIEGNDGAFVVKTEQGLSVPCRVVVLAIGLRGTPRKLEVPGEETQKVIYRLDDPTEFHGQHVLVVGGGDSAVEAAVQLATESDAAVTLSYRQAAFTRIKSKNREAIAALIASGRVTAAMETAVAAIEEKTVTLTKVDGGTARIKNDTVIVNIGGELPTAFLKAMGISIKRYTGQEKAPAQGAGKLTRDEHRRRRLAMSLLILGTGIIVSFALIGGDYYFTPVDDRPESEMHEFMKPSGLWGHGIGIIATVVMLANFLYPLRKRWKVLKGKRSIRSWLTLHMFVGTLSPFVIAFHAAFLTKNLLAVWTWVALAIVVSTGIFGRFMFGLFPAEAGKLLQLQELQARMSSLEASAQGIMERAHAPDAVRAALRSLKPAEGMPFWRACLTEPGRRREWRRQLRLAAASFEERAQLHELSLVLRNVAKLQFQVVFYAKLKSFFRIWLVLHVVLASSMVLVIAAHIAVSLFFGFNWMLAE